MKKSLFVTSLLALCLSLLSASAQPRGRGGMGGPPQGPKFDAAMAKLFGDNSAFSANLEFQMTAEGKPMTMPGKMAYLDGKSRFEVNMTDMKGGNAPPPEAMEHMKAMGMDTRVTVSRPDKKATFMIFPGMQAYAETPMKEADSDTTAEKSKIETTELGKETVDGHPCVKTKVVVTDDNGKSHEFTVWNATDLKKFPVKIDTGDGGHAVTMLFKDVKLSKPEASLFDPPADFQHYDSVPSMMQQEMMKRMGGGMGMPPMH